MRGGQGRTLALTCELLNCLPSDLEGRRISPTDRIFVNHWYNRKMQDQAKLLSGMFKRGSSQAFGGGK